MLKIFEKFEKFYQWSISWLIEQKLFTMEMVEGDYHWSIIEFKKVWISKENRMNKINTLIHLLMEYDDFIGAEKLLGQKPRLNSAWLLLSLAFALLVPFSTSIRPQVP